jgi:predicted O-methyltransferase YrrM
LHPELAHFLDELHRRGVDHDGATADRLARLRNLEPETARLLAVLVQACAARRILELGTSNGYSTVWLADAARAGGGRVVSVEVDPARSALARENLSAAGLDAHVDLRTDDAGLTLRDSADASWDLVFLDAERPAYVDYWPDLVRVLRAGGLLAVDNVLSHADELAEFRAVVANDERVEESFVPIGAGLLLVVKEPSGLV